MTESQCDWFLMSTAIKSSICSSASMKFIFSLIITAFVCLSISFGRHAPSLAMLLLVAHIHDICAFKYRIANLNFSPNLTSMSSNFLKGCLGITLKMLFLKNDFFVCFKWNFCCVFKSFWCTDINNDFWKIKKLLISCSNLIYFFYGKRLWSNSAVG